MKKRYVVVERATNYEKRGGGEEEVIKCVMKKFIINLKGLIIYNL
jgi:hypothetical protein